LRPPPFHKETGLTYGGFSLPHCRQEGLQPTIQAGAPVEITFGPCMFKAHCYFVLSALILSLLMLHDHFCLRESIQSPLILLPAPALAFETLCFLSISSFIWSSHPHAAWTNAQFCIVGNPNK